MLVCRSIFEQPAGCGYVARYFRPWQKIARFCALAARMFSCLVLDAKTLRFLHGMSDMNRRFQSDAPAGGRFQVDEFLAQMTRKGRQRAAVTEIHTIASRAAQYGDYGDLLAPNVERALRARGIERPYSHQEEAWRHLNQGEDLVIVTPTASGKTLCYYGPCFRCSSMTARDRRSCCTQPKRSRRTSALS